MPSKAKGSGDRTDVAAETGTQRGDEAMNIFGKQRAKHRRAGIFCALASIMLCGCAPKSPQPAPAPDADGSQASADVWIGDRYIGAAALEKPGLYALQDDALRVSERGKPQWLAATNADRGFGFRKPAGASFPDAVTSWYASDLPLRLHQIQMTRYRGAAVPAASAHADVDDANTAWIAEKNIPVAVNCRDRRCRIGVPRPLEPGFYVIHDDSLFRAARQDEVTAYYPFVIEKDGKNPWLSQAESCFDAIYKRNESIRGGGGDGAKDDAAAGGELTACMGSLRLAWKIAPDKRGDYVLKLLYLGSLMNPDDRAIRRELDARCDGKSQGLARDIWRRSQLNLIRDYADVSAKYHASETVSPEAAHAIVAACDAEYADADAIDMLLWRPFYALDARDDRLAGLFDIVVRGAAWQAQLADLLGALAYRDVAERAKTDRALSAGLKRIQSHIPESFRIDATLMTPRAGVSGIAFGPIALGGVPDDAQTIWRATLQGYFGAIASCAQKHDAPKKSMFIIEIPLNGSPLDAASHIVVRDPLAQLRQTPAISPSLVSCMVSALSGLAIEPALETTQRAYVAVTFGE